MAIIDVFTYNGETEILKLHLSVLSEHVDKFIIVEANRTFTDKHKPLYFFRDQRFFKAWWSKIDYFPIKAWDDAAIWQQAKESPNTRGAQHWQQEFYIKENIQKALTKLRDDDIVFVGDVDEIWYPAVLEEIRSNLLWDAPKKLKLDVYAYYLNNRSDEAFWGTTVATYRQLKGGILNHIRSDKELQYNATLGWHFTSMGGLKEVQRKLNDSYTKESYNVNVMPGHVENCLKERKDLLLRPFTYTIDESEWPEHLKENRDKYRHLLWPPTTA